MTLSVLIAVQPGTLKQSLVTLSSLDQAGIEPVLVYSGPDRIAFKGLPANSTIVQTGPTDPATGLTRALSVAQGRWMTWLYPGEYLLPHAAGVLKTVCRAPCDLVFLPRIGAETVPSNPEGNWLWRTGFDSGRVVLPLRALKQGGLHFPHGFGSADLFLDAAARMLASRPKRLEIPLIAGPQRRGPDIFEVLAMIRALLQLMPRLPFFSVPSARCEATLALFEHALKAVASLPEGAQRRTLTATLVALARGLDDRLRADLARAFAMKVETSFTDTLRWLNTALS